MIAILKIWQNLNLKISSLLFACHRPNPIPIG